ncbi:hypothetical protein BT96DRAFT_819231 [Gymnopus androsaceus JB14]|uniref:RING-type domain-containing protein n=1 Tax=Gymnopus androsaceus JB14 TaxID=1447944 RepID=A0A6A4HU18_9AGAR|nr:hypothetical protein BT96DRAFT_819231 [Gymnopus androsaceus JB14]
MNSLTYVDPPNQNLVCCICRMPFVDPCTNKTCSHTFCRECIVQSLIRHSPQCPIDRSPLRMEDICPADPIVRSLVDELLVKCSNESAGCSYTCQRQLLDVHIKNDCLYTLVPCKDGCSQETHNSNCTGKYFKCEACETEHPCSARVEHASCCYAVRVRCPHEPHGCPWEGRRKDLPTHTSACPYEAIKGFFAIHDIQKAALNDENTLLKHKIDTLESQLRIAQFELHCAESALGPWFRNSRSRSIPPSSQLPTQLQPSSAFTSRPSISPTDVSITQYFPDMPVNDSYGPASYAPPEDELWASLPPAPERPELPSSMQSMSHPWIPNQNWQSNSYLPTGTRLNQNVVAPLNLNTTLEGTMEGLRESISVLSTSLDSLGRRSDIALTNETLRLNEEVMSLRVTMHGLRMQVHTIMMDRNAQVTGHGPGIEPLFMPPDGQWPSPIPNRLYAMQNAPPNSITKL